MTLEGSSRLKTTSQTSSFLANLEELMRNITERVSNCSWGEETDPDLEQSLLKEIGGVILHNSFQLENSLRG